MNKKVLFSQFTYKLGKVSITKQEVVATYLYEKNNRKVNRYYEFNKVKSYKPNDYIRLAKQQIEQEVKNGFLEKYSDEYFLDDKRKPRMRKSYVIIAAIICIIFASLFTWKMLEPNTPIVPPTPSHTTVEIVDSPDGISLDHTDAIIGEEYQGKIIVDISKTESKVLNTIEVKSNETTLVESTQYTITLNDEKTEGNLVIFATYVTGPITIKVTLFNPDPRAHKELTFTCEENDALLGINWFCMEGAPTREVDINYQINDGEWKKLDVHQQKDHTNHQYPIATLKVGDEVRVRGDNAYWSYYPNGQDIISFSTDKKVSVSNNIMSLLDSDDFAELDTAPKEGCFYSLFLNGAGAPAIVNESHIVDASQMVLPATKLNPNCYSFMFYRNQELKKAPEILPGNTLRGSCYSSMFESCGSLQTAPSLPGTGLAGSCYSRMFSECGSLKTAPSLPATTLANDCYTRMFYGCSSLQTAPSLPATTLANNCYQNMFSNCRSLATAPTSLPAKELTQNCYNSMFSGCSALTAPPAVAAESLANNSCQEMFSGCTSLYVNRVGDGLKIFTCPSTSGLNNPVTNMFNSTQGGIVTPIAGANYYCNPDGPDPLINKELTFTCEVDGSSLLLDYYSYYYSDPSSIPTRNIDIYYKVDDGAWTKVDSVQQDIGEPDTEVTHQFEIVSNLNKGQQISVRGDNEYWSYVDDDPAYDEESPARENLSFVTNGEGKFSVASNVMSLIDSDEFATLDTIPSPYCFSYLFTDYSETETANILDASKLFLPLNLTKGCYEHMFDGHANLTKAPTLPASTLADYCYDEMFAYCTSLANAPQLPARELADHCYYEMFFGCSSMKTAPQLPAQELADDCYSAMFYNCSNLVIAPVLPALELTDSCYEDMFSGCTSLVNTPALPATKLADYCYNGMFSDCTLLTAVPTLSVMELEEGCYCRMFENCKSLNTAPNLPAQTIAPYCYTRMFYGCSSLINAPSSLPATTLMERCYDAMFYECRLLETPPIISAATLADNCCFTMFYGCTSLNVSENSGAHKFFTCPPISGADVPVNYMFAGTKGFTNDPTPGRSYYYN